jgi:beta-glucanase (GH16 family)
MRVLRITVGLSIVVAALCGALAAELDYQLVWSDEFDGMGVDPSKWSFQIGDGCPNLCGWGNNELQYYHEENATVTGGQLVITAREESFGGKDYTSTRMRTIGLGDWKYGRFEMRATMPVGQGLWPAFWMLSTDDAYGGWAASGEIDIMEYLGHRTDHVSGAIHYGGSWPDNLFWSKGFTLPAGNFADRMHDFALEWDPHELRWYVDAAVCLPEPLELERRGLPGALRPAVSSHSQRRRRRQPARSPRRDDPVPAGYGRGPRAGLPEARIPGVRGPV